MAQCSHDAAMATRSAAQLLAQYTARLQVHPSVPLVGPTAPRNKGLPITDEKCLGNCWLRGYSASFFELCFMHQASLWTIQGNASLVTSMRLACVCFPFPFLFFEFMPTNSKSTAP